MGKWRDSHGLRAICISISLGVIVAGGGGCGGKGAEGGAGGGAGTQASNGSSSGTGGATGSTTSTTGSTTGVGAGGAGATGSTTATTTTAGSTTAGSTTATSTTGTGTGGGPAGNLQPGTTMLTIQAAGQSRSVYLHVPEAVTHGQVPLVLALHGDGDTAQNFVSSLGLAADADAEGFVLAAPQGITRDVPVHVAGMVVQTVPQVDWDPYNSILQDGSFSSADNDDLPLLDAIRQELVASGSVDVHRIIVYGYSQGGYLSFRYGMSDAADIACAAVLAAGNPLPGTMLIELAARKVPVVLQIGTADSGYGNAQQTAQELQANGNLVELDAIQGAGHVPAPGDPKAPLDWCMQHALP